MAPSGDGADLAVFDGAELGKANAAHPDDSASATERRSASSTSSPPLDTGFA